jgi:hypothetical protein
MINQILELKKISFFFWDSSCRIVTELKILINEFCMVINAELVEYGVSESLLLIEEYNASLKMKVIESLQLFLHNLPLVAIIHNMS